MKLFKKAKKGFTLVELVVVIAVIAILSAVSVGAYFGITDSANNSRLEQETKQLHTNIQAISLGTSSNQSLGKDGLTVADIDQFELDLEANAGEDFEVLTSTPLLLSRPTVVLSTSEYSKAPGALVKYHTFNYYNPNISNKVVTSDVVTGDMDIENIPAIPVDKGADDVSNTTIYFLNNAGWKNVNIYAFSHNEETDTTYENAVFPGLPMQLVRDNLYVYQVTSTFDTIIFNNKVEGIGTQTGDLVMPEKDSTANCYTFDGSTGSWGELPEEIVPPEFVAPERVQIVGSMTDWEANPVDLVSSDEGHTWVKEDFLMTKDQQFKVWFNLDGEDHWGVAGVDHFGYDDLDAESKELFVDGGTRNIKVVNSAYYTITYNHDTKTIHVDKGEDYIDTTPFVAPTSVGLIGSFEGSNWTDEVELTSSDEGYTWSVADVLFREGDAGKIRLNDNWGDAGIDNFGYADLDETSKELFNDDGGDFKAKTSAYYSFTYDAENHVISVLKGEDWVGFDSVDFAGNINNFGETPITLDTVDGVTYTVNDIEMNANDGFKLRINGSWDDGKCFGYDSLDAESQALFTRKSDDGNAVAIAAGTYDISFNMTTKTITVTKDPVLPCEHDWNNAEGQCSKCPEKHDHSSWSEGACGVCGYECTHNFEGNVESCPICGVDNPDFTEESVSLIISATKTSMNINELGNIISVSDPREGEYEYTYKVAEEDIDLLEVTSEGKIYAKESGTATVYVVDSSNSEVKSNEIEITITNLYRLYFMDNWNWGNVYIHIWGSSDSTYHTEWNSCPKLEGVYGSYTSPVHSADRTVFYYDLPKDAKCLLKNGDGNKLPDINSLEVGKYYGQLWENNSNSYAIHDISTIF